MINQTVLHLLVCPQTGGPLTYKKEKNELWSASSHLAYPIEDGIPIMLIDKARMLTAAEKSTLKKKKKHP